MRWDPSGRIETPCAQIDVSWDVTVTVTLRFSYMTDGPENDLVVSFGSDVLALMSHAEFTHPWADYGENDARPVPRLGEPWDRYAFPSLTVRESLWLESFSESRLVDFQGARLTHYRFVSLDNTVDVLVREDPDVAWVAGSAPADSWVDGG